MEQYTIFKDIAMRKPYFAAPERYTTSFTKEDRQETGGLSDQDDIDYTLSKGDVRLMKASLEKPSYEEHWPFIGHSGSTYWGTFTRCDSSTGIESCCQVQ